MGLHERRGLFFGGLAVLLFSFSFPATKAAVMGLDGMFVSCGRAVVAAALSAAWLAWAGRRLPARHYWGRLMLVAGGVVIGFPVLSAYAMQHVPSSHAAVIGGLAPALTAVIGVLRGGERPSWRFWLASVVGTVSVVAFATTRASGRLSSDDVLLFVAVLAVAVGYAEGGLLAKELGGPYVICCALILSLPLTVPAVLWSVAHSDLATAGAQAWLGFAYVSVMSMFLGFFAWYRGLGEGGVARVSQLQLVQPLLALVWSAILLGEALQASMWLTSVSVMACVLVSSRARVASAPVLPPRLGQPEAT